MSEDERPLVRHAERFRLTGAGQNIEGAGTILRVGSKDGNSLRLQNETVSRYHFEIEPTPLGFVLRDLGSTNGTFVDDYACARSTSSARTIKARRGRRCSSRRSAKRCRSRCRAKIASATCSAPRR